ncbi:uncharacterized protein DUF1801 [Mangrovibacterium diazotrophicum]|uniref:Uncharacterized protein DUF1801 n=2 Tax=Mangrovibacterium diazotrophicum TaxID=1261403 RepID=A0A419W6D8_9BACT|nr:uncharacterized protein DUF1801 [Mangrovibacterium diazotrophicum]
MGKMQPMKFRSVEEMLDFLPENELAVVEKLRDMIYANIPEVREKLSYNVPYFSIHSRICFIWPSAIPWGKVERHGIKLGFCKGHLLHDELNYLEKENRKEVYCKTYYKPEDIDEDLLKTFLFEAVEIDRMTAVGKPR